MSETIRQILADLQCDESVKEKAMDILEQAVKRRLVSSKGMSGQAAGMVYIASILAGNRLTQEAISTAAGVTSTTVGKNYIRIARGLGYGES